MSKQTCRAPDCNEYAVDIDSGCCDMHKQSVEPTPASWWRVNGEPDPHGTRYDCQRHELTMGHVTDDELANEVFLKNYDIAVLQAGKERIRWLSRLAEKLEAENAALKAQLESSKDENLDNLKSFFEIN